MNKILSYVEKNKSKIEGYDPKEIAMGIQVEMEHTDNPKYACRIAKDHLDETSDYYTKHLKSGLVDEKLDLTDEIVNILKEKKMGKTRLIKIHDSIYVKLEKNEENMRKARYIKRIGSPGNYKYVYAEGNDKFKKQDIVTTPEGKGIIVNVEKNKVIVNIPQKGKKEFEKKQLSATTSGKKTVDTEKFNEFKSMEKEADDTTDPNEKKQIEKKLQNYIQEIVKKYNISVKEFFNQFLEYRNTAFFSMEKARPTKYYKRVPKASGKGYNYYYTKDQYEKSKKESAAPKSVKKGILSGIMSFFGFKNEKQAKEKAQSTYNENKDKLQGVDLNTFTNYMNEYLSNKEKWDKKLQKKEVVKDKKTGKVSSIKSDKSVPSGDKKKGFNLSVMRQVAEIVLFDDKKKDNRSSVMSGDDTYVVKSSNGDEIKIEKELKSEISLPSGQADRWQTFIKRKGNSKWEKGPSGSFESMKSYSEKLAQENGAKIAESKKITSEEKGKSSKDSVEKSVTSFKEKKQLETDIINGKAVSSGLLDKYPDLKKKWGDSIKTKDNKSSVMSDEGGGKIDNPWTMTKEEWEKERRSLEPNTFGSSSKVSVSGKEEEMKRLIKLLSGVTDDAQKRLKEAQKKGETIPKKELDELMDRMATKVSHRDVIEKALKEGKDVPEEVLKDYPDLKDNKRSLMSGDKEIKTFSKKDRTFIVTPGKGKSGAAKTGKKRNLFEDTKDLNRIRDILSNSYKKLTDEQVSMLKKWDRQKGESDEKLYVRKMLKNLADQKIKYQANDVTLPTGEEIHLVNSSNNPSGMTAKQVAEAIGSDKEKKTDKESNQQTYDAAQTTIKQFEEEYDKSAYSDAEWADYLQETKDNPDWFEKKEIDKQKEYEKALKDSKKLKEKLLGPKMFKASIDALSESLEKAKKMPVGTVSNGRKKVAEGKWVPVTEGKAPEKDEKPKDKKGKKPTPEDKQPGEKTSALKNALKKMATILADMLSGRDAVQPTGSAVEETGENVKNITKRKKKKPITEPEKRQKEDSKKEKK